MALCAFLFTTAKVVSIPGMPGRGAEVVYGDKHAEYNRTSRKKMCESVYDYEREVN